jgi:mannose-6-phosphate isomerase-like protein (cupin superfamily)
MSRPWLRSFALLLVLPLLLGGATPTLAQEATPGSSGAEFTTEALAQVQLPATANPALPAAFDVWLWGLIPGEELRFETGDAPPSIAADVVLAGEYTVRSEGRLQVQRAAGLEEVAPGTDVTVHPGDVVIYVENQAAQVMRNPGDETAQAISFGAFSAAPAADATLETVSQADWERSGLAGQELTVTVERLTVPPGSSLPPFVPDVHAPRVFVVEEGEAQWVLLAPARATPPAPAAIPFGREQTIAFQPLPPGEQLQLRNDEDRPLVLLQVTVRAADAATPVAATPMS